jgi:lipopolysaccharide transport system ATP-binding protein
MINQPEFTKPLDDDVLIRVEHVSKKYCKVLRKSMFYGIQDIGRNMFGLSSHSEKLRQGEFWAVDDVSFEIKRGESLGLIGPNGSGKSTLLKMLNGIFWPDKGKITVKGKVGALIEVGAGFHPLLTGRENIYVNGAILGMTRREIDDKFDDIVNLADIGDFLDTPVKAYSSGMFVRLGFAVAVHSDPDILLVDEVLAVGDRNFQIKCFRKINELKNVQNVSMVLVSHNVYAMRQYTKKSMVLEKGSIVFDGSSEDAISFYVNKMVTENVDIAQLEGGLSNGVVRQVIFRDITGKQIHKILTGYPIIIDFKYETKEKITNPIFGISFYNSNELFTGFWNSFEKVRLPDIVGKGTVRITVSRLDFPVDVYSCSVVVCEAEEANVIEWKNLPQKISS